MNLHYSIRHSQESEKKRQRETEKETDRNREREENERENFILMNSHGIVGVGNSKICRAGGQTYNSTKSDDSDLSLNSAGLQARNSGYGAVFS